MSSERDNGILYSRRRRVSNAIEITPQGQLLYLPILEGRGLPTINRLQLIFEELRQVLRQRGLEIMISTAIKISRVGGSLHCAYLWGNITINRL